jgi:hypothetical protein
MSETLMEPKTDIKALREALAGLDGLTLRAEGCEVDVLSDGDGIDSVCFALVGKLPAEDVAFCTALAAAANALPALLDEIEALRAREAHMRRFAESMVEDGHPVLMGFAYQIQVILDTQALPMPPEVKNA